VKGCHNKSGPHLSADPLRCYPQPSEPPTERPSSRFPARGSTTALHIRHAGWAEEPRAMRAGPQQTSGAPPEPRQGGRKPGRKPGRNAPHLLGGCLA